MKFLICQQVVPKEVYERPIYALLTMGLRNFLIVLTIVVVPYVGYQTYLALQPPPTIKNLPEPWWTNTDPKTINPAIRPFKIDVPEPVNIFMLYVIVFTSTLTS